MHLGQIYPVETLSKVKKEYLHLEVPQFCFRINGCCYGYCD